MGLAQALNTLYALLLEFQGHGAEGHPVRKELQRLDAMAALLESSETSGLAAKKESDKKEEVRRTHA